jgi:adenylate cyclase class 2
MDSSREIEAKFSVPDLEEIRRCVLNLGGKVSIAKHLEHNRYFDTPDRHLKSGRQILRIRSDSHIHMTYKRQAGTFEDRIEIELALDNVDDAQAMLQALGYELILRYSKERETYELHDVQVMLDELPFGQFVEIEGPSLDSVRKVSNSLGLDWQKRVSMGYLALFERARELVNLPPEENSFDKLRKDHPLRSVNLELVDASKAEEENRISS